MKIDPSILQIGADATYQQAEKSRAEGGVPIGSALVIDKTVVAVGHNRRVQKLSNILHGETDCIENAGHTADFLSSILFTSLSPCTMCAGTVLLYKIPTVVILDNENVDDFETSEDRLRDAGVEVVIHPHEPTIRLNREFQKNPDTRRIWLGDVGK